MLKGFAGDLYPVGSNHQNYFHEEVNGSSRTT